MIGTIHFGEPASQRYTLQRLIDASRSRGAPTSFDVGTHEERAGGAAVVNYFQGDTDGDGVDA